MYKIKLIRNNVIYKTWYYETKEQFEKWYIQHSKYRSSYDVIAYEQIYNIKTNTIEWKQIRK